MTFRKADLDQVLMIIKKVTTSIQLSRCDLSSAYAAHEKSKQLLRDEPGSTKWCVAHLTKLAIFCCGSKLLLIANSLISLVHDAPAIHVLCLPMSLALPNAMLAGCSQCGKAASKEASA